MPIITCPNCQAQYDVPETLIGRKVKCRQCELKFETGAEAQAALADADADATADLAAPPDPAAGSSEAGPPDAPGKPDMMMGQSAQLTPPPDSDQVLLEVPGSGDAEAAPKPETRAADTGVNADASPGAAQPPSDTPKTRPPEPAPQTSAPKKAPARNETFIADDEEFERAIAAAVHEAGDSGRRANAVAAAADGDDTGAPMAAPVEGTLTDAGFRKLEGDDPSTQAWHQEGSDWDEYGGTMMSIEVPDDKRGASRLITGKRARTAHMPAPVGAVPGGFVVPAEPATPTALLVILLLCVLAIIGLGVNALFNRATPGSENAPVANTPATNSDTPATNGHPTGNRPPANTDPGVADIGPVAGLDRLVTIATTDPIGVVRRHETYLAASDALQAEFRVRQEALTAAWLHQPGGNAISEDGAWRQYQQRADAMLRMLSRYRDELGKVDVELRDGPTASDGSTRLTARVTRREFAFADGQPELSFRTFTVRYRLQAVPGGGFRIADRAVTD